MSKLTIDQATIKKLATLVNKENLAEIEVGNGDDYIRVTRTVAGNVVSAPTAVAPAPAPAVSAPVADSSAPASAPTTDDKNAVKSPIVGTAYLAPSPDADTFVNVGKTVKKGDTLLIIEAMKVMNPIVAPHDGTVQEILVGDADPVEFDQPLIVLV